jgi:hypothetical protein
MVKFFLAALVSAMFSLPVFAQDSTDPKAVPNVQNPKTEVQKNIPGNGDDVDEIITNKKMRAESGSKSKWSIGSQLIYYGGTINSPFAASRPNLAGGAGNTAVTNIGGYLGVAYKITTTDRLSLNFGIRWITPFQKNLPSDYLGKRADIFDPQVLYNKMYKWWGVQSVLGVGPQLYTRSDQTAYGYQGGATLYQNNVCELGHSGLSLGLYMQADYNIFDKSDPKSLAHGADWDVDVSPFLEYVINDTLNIRTVFNWALWEHDRNASTALTLYKNQNVQSIGVGISVTRDIFLYPNIQFQPKDITHVFSANDTNVGIQANINVF